jgi:hypothetical protein
MFWILAISLICYFGIVVIRLFVGVYGTEEYRILVNLQNIFAVPAIYYALVGIESKL